MMRATPGVTYGQGGGCGRRRRTRGRRPRGAGRHGGNRRLGPTLVVTWTEGSQDGGGPFPTSGAVATRLEDVRGVGQVEEAKILGDLGACPIVIHLEGRPDPILAVLTVCATGAETLTGGFRVGKLVPEVQQCPEDGGRLRFRIRGIYADVGRPDGVDPTEESRGVAPQDPTGAEGLEENDGRHESPLAEE